MSRTVLRIFHHVRHKPTCTTTETSKRLDISDMETRLGSKKQRCLSVPLVFLHMQKAGLSLDGSYILHISKRGRLW